MAALLLPLLEGSSRQNSRLHISCSSMLFFSHEKKSFIIANGTRKSASKYLTVQPAKQSWAHQSASATAADSRDAVTGGELEAIWAHDPSSADRLTWAEGHLGGGIRKAVGQSCCRLMVFQRAANVTDARGDFIFSFYFLSFRNVCHTARIRDIV